jgi:hypothetical protein
MMAQWNEHAETSSRRRGVQGALANKQAADSRADALASTFRELMGAGFLSQRSLAGELNRRGIPTAQGGRWHYNTLVRRLTLGPAGRRREPALRLAVQMPDMRQPGCHAVRHREPSRARPSAPRRAARKGAELGGNYAPRDPDADLP